jgi:hypothetical protein
MTYLKFLSFLWPVIFMPPSIASETIGETPAPSTGRVMVFASATDVPGCTPVGPSDAVAIAMVAGGGDDPVEVEILHSPVEGPWIGIQLSPVPPALASHLKLEGDYLMISNVIKDSPADEGGLDRYDVMLEINDQAAPGKVEEFLRIVREFEVGSSQRLTVLRGGERETLTLTIGNRSADVKWEFKYPPAEDEHSRALMQMRGHLLRKGPGGEWQFDNLKDLHRLQGLEELLQKQAIPMPPMPPAGPGSHFVLVERQGEELLQIRKGPDGAIVVTRTRSENGERKTTTETYPDEQALEEGDPKAYEVYNKAVSETGKDAHGDRRFLFRVGPNDLNDPNFWWFETPAPEAHKEAADRLREARRLLVRRLSDDAAPPAMRFEVAVDGTLRVTVREDDKELVLNFQDEQALMANRPDLHKEYARLHGQ